MEKRLVNAEFNQLKRYAAFVSELAYCREGLAEHWKMVENGEERISKCTDEALKLFDEILDTVPQAQIRSIRNAVKDYKVAFVPKMLPETRNVVIDREAAKALIDKAQEQCVYCIKDAAEAETCPIYIISIGVCPPDMYDSTMCPYARAEWED